MEKDAAGSSLERKNSDISRTSPAAYPTITSNHLGSPHGTPSGPPALHRAGTLFRPKYQLGPASLQDREKCGADTLEELVKGLNDLNVTARTGERWIASTLEAEFRRLSI